MAFNVSLYSISDDPKTVNKTLGNIIATPSCRPTENVDLINPIFVLDYSTAYLNANYCYCPLFERYYYINNKEIEIGKKIVLHCNVDPLMSFKDQILNCTACITRSESIGHPTEIVDDRLPVDPNKKEILSQVSPFKPIDSPDEKYFLVSIKYFGNYADV